MCNRHELPSILPSLELKDVQTSVLKETLQERLYNQSGPFFISDVLNDWLKIDPCNVTMDQQIRVGALLQSIGCTRVRTLSGIIYLPPEDNVPSPDYQRRCEPLSTEDPFPLFSFGPGSALLTAIFLAGSGVGIVFGLMAIGSWIHAGMAILPLGATW